MTENHDYQTPAEGETEWHIPLNQNFSRLDGDVEIRDREENRQRYDSKDGAKFIATDTGAVYVGNGTSWDHFGDVGRVDGNIHVSEVTPSTPETDDLWVDTSEQTFKVYDGSSWLSFNEDGGTDENVIENFERSDPLADYVGDTGSFTIDETADSIDSCSLRATDSTQDETAILRPDLSPTVEMGQTYQYRVCPDTPGGQVYFYYFVQPGATNDEDVSAYRLALDDHGTSSKIRLYRKDDGVTTEVASTYLSTLSGDEWYEVGIAPTTDDIHTVTVSDSSGSHLGSLRYDASSDTQVYRSGGIGWGQFNPESTKQAQFDYLREESVEVPDQGIDSGSGESLIYTNASELDTIVARALDGQEPWASAWSRVRASADDALGRSPRSVTDDDGQHTFNTTESGQPDYMAAIDMKEWIRDLGLAYYVTGQDRYARKAIDFIYHWYLDPDTYMAPSLITNHRLEGHFQHITLPGMWYGAALVRGHPYWEQMPGSEPWHGGSASNGQDAFRDWLRTYIDKVADVFHKANNIGHWQIQAELAGYAYLGDDAAFESSLASYKDERLWGDFNDCTTNVEGSFQLELQRSDAFFYQIFRMQAMTYIAEISRHMGHDVYSFNAPTDSCGGSTLRKTFDFTAQYALNRSAWQWGTDESIGATLRDEGGAIFELAHSHWGDSTYRRVLDAANRPIDGDRTAGWTTFTHGNLFDLQ